MSKLEFLEEIPINVQNTLRQLLGRFQTVRDGLPELIKNSKDQYAALGITERADRVIVVVIDSPQRRVGVLDFGGATNQEFLRWRKWSDPNDDRAAAASDIEGGHGNGGKAFMVGGSTQDSFFESCRDGLRTKMGYSNADEERLFWPAFFEENRKLIDNVKIESTRKQLDLVLAGLGATYVALPLAAHSAFERRQAFSMVQVNGVRDWAGRLATVRHLVSGLPNEIMNQPQAALSIETSSVFFVIDGVVLSQEPLDRSYPEPKPGFENLALIPIPAKLEDPHTNEMIETGGGDAATHHLQLRTSNQSLRMANNKPLNVVRVRSARNVVGNWSVADIHSRAESAFIFGELRVASLGPDHQVGADREHLADTPLVRALRSWTTEQIADLAAKIQKAFAREHTPQEVEKASDGLRKMRDAMREFLEEMTRGKFTGQGGKGQEGDDGDGPPPPPPKPEGTVVRQIVLEGGAQSIALAKGTSVPLMVRAYDLSPDGEKLVVKSPRLELIADPPELTSLEGKRTLKANAVGRTTIRFRDPLTGIESNRVEVEVVQAVGAEIQELPARLLLQGEHVPLRIVFKTTRGARGDLLVDARPDLVVDADVDEPLMGRVDRYGVFTAGGQEGTATVRVRYGAGPADTVVGGLQIGPNRAPVPPKKGGNDGGDVPVILLCGAEAPNMEHYPDEQRTIMPSEQWPTIIDYDPIFEPTIFINPDSKESLQVRGRRGGRTGTAGLGTQIFLQFLAIKCFEILKRLYVRQSLKEGATTDLQFRQAFADAEVQCAPFIEHAFNIAHELTASIREVE